MEKKQPEDVDELVNVLKGYIDQLNDTLINDIPKEIREANKQYRDLIHIAGELNARLAKL
jgi:hypothetical protein